jgi:ATP-dependent Clp protease adaptor protein ClpS
MKPYNAITANSGNEHSVGDLLVATPKVQAKRPPLYKVVLLNDDFTPMEFVVQVLREVFHKSQEESVSIMLEVHNKGAGVCGVYTRDVAETKADIVVAVARKQEYPLQCLVEQE